MSRLDDELKTALRRQEPSPDFTARLMERINTSPAPRPGFRQRLAAFFDSFDWRWAAIGATAVLLVAIGTAQYRRLHQTAVEPNSEVVALAPTPTAPNPVPVPVVKTPKAEQPGINRSGPRRIGTHAVAIRKEPRPSPEAEAAKERVLFALQVAGATLNDVQRAIRDDGPENKPEPLNNQ
jgi:negative regulator of sigma E activity